MSLKIFFTCFIILFCMAALFLGFKSKKKWYVAFTAIVCFGAFISGILKFTSLYYGQDSFCIATSGEDDCDVFSLNIDCRKLSYEHTYGKFATKLSLDEIEKEIEKEYGDKVVLSGDDNEIMITMNNNVVTVKLEETKKHGIYRYIYYVCAEVIGVEKTEGEYVDIPFPKEYLNVTGAYEKEMPIKCSYEELADFYKYFTNVTFENEEIVIHQKNPVHIKINEGKVFFEFD